MNGLIIALMEGALVSASGQCAPEWLDPAPGFGTNGNGVVHALAVYDPDGPGAAPAELHAGGQFTFAGGVAANHVARWDGLAWHALGAGADNNVYAMSVFDADEAGPALPVLVVGGWLSAAGGIPMSRVGAWNGTGWSPLGPGLTGSRVRAMHVFDGDGAGPLPAELIVGGNITHAGGLQVNGVARWNGAAWGALGSGLAGSSGMIVDPFAHAMATFDADGNGPAAAELIVTGSFIEAGGAPAAYIAAWDGASWRPLGSGLATNGESTRGYALAAIPAGLGSAGPRLAVGGLFEEAGGIASTNLAVWDGAAWGSIGSANSTVLSLAVFDVDGAGPGAPELIAAGGGFTEVGGVAAEAIARWDGAGWHAMGAGQNGDVHVMRRFDPDGAGPGGEELIVGGLVTFIDGQFVQNLGRWGCDGGCYADCNGDSALTIADFGCFQGRFAAADPYADCNASGGLTIADFACFQGKFVAGCP